jgi:hypothetical protein
MIVGLSGPVMVALVAILIIGRARFSTAMLREDRLRKVQLELVAAPRELPTLRRVA